MFPRTTELEITLVICVENPSHVVARLAALASLGDHALHRPTTTVLHDRYFDLPGDHLRASGFALRLRESDHRWWLCLKGGSRRRGPAVERVEIEGALDDPGLVARMAAALGSARRGRGQPGTADAQARVSRACAALGAIGPTHDPVATFRHAGWSLIQDRQTLRRCRDVMEARARGKRIAQLAIDTVTYVVAGTALLHHEAEIEACSGTNAKTLATLARTLQEASPAALQPWHLSKLHTGVALAALAARHGPATLASASGDLLPGTYTRLEAAARGA